MLTMQWLTERDGYTAQNRYYFQYFVFTAKTIGVSNILLRTRLSDIYAYVAWFDHLPYSRLICSGKVSVCLFLIYLYTEI